MIPSSQETKSTCLLSARLLAVLSTALLVAASVGLFAFLLARFPFDGLSGQDSYAYYYQARELWSGLWGLPPPQWPFLGEGLYHWPVGYHLHIMLGFLFGSQSEVGGRVITLAMAALVPALVALLVGLIWYKGGGAVPRTVAGLVAGVVVLLTGVYNRAGLSLMADVPAIFWTTLAMYCLLRTWPPSQDAVGWPRAKVWWAIACGGSLGSAILLRYVSLLLIVAMSLYLALWHWQRRTSAVRVARRVSIYTIGIALAAMACALLPQLIYTVSQGVKPIDTSGTVVWSISNLFQTTLSGPDGTQSFAHPMAGFYFVDSLIDVSVGFLSPLYLPAFIVGLYALARQRNLAIGGLLLSWWLLPATVFSGGLYQAHRFVIMFLPVLAALIGIGVGEILLAIMRLWSMAPNPRKIAIVLTSAAILLALAVGFIQSARTSYSMASALAASKNQELDVVSAAENAVKGDISSDAKVVDFGISIALYHYTGWPVLDIYNADEAAITKFLAGSGRRLVVVPETSMATQWAGTPSGERWEWLQTHYNLTSKGGSGGFNVYMIGNP